MRVITGTARGRKLEAPVGETTRPTADRVKESIFNIIQFDIEGRDVLDLFAGSGQMGIECISRGAKSCTFVERDRAAIEVLKRNVESVGFDEQSIVIAGDSSAALAKMADKKFGLIMLDPPYATDLLNDTVAQIIKIDKLLLGGVLLCESGRNDKIAEVPAPYIFKKEFIYGAAKISVFTREEDK